MSYELKWETDGVIKQFSGNVTDEEFMAATEEVQGHAGFDSIWFVINDLSEVSGFKVSIHVIEAFFASISEAYYSNSKVKVAFVTTDPEIERQFNASVLTNPIPYRSRVFGSVSDARHWCKVKKTSRI